MENSVCVLCGLPLLRRGISENINGNKFFFCCPGCRHVFFLLSSATGVLPEDFRRSDLFQICVKAGIIPNTESEEATIPCADEIPPIPFTIKIEGMWCPSCSWVLEAVLKHTRGVVDASVAFVTDTARGTYLPHVISLEEIGGIASRLGYRTIGDHDDGMREKKKQLISLSLSAILTVQVMMIAMALDGGFFTRFNLAEIRYLSIPLMLITIPVVFWGGYPILKKGLFALAHGSPSMDTMIAVAALSAFVYSALRVFQGDIHLYFDTAAMLVTFVLFGRLLETRLREKVLSNIKGLYEITRQKVRLADTREQWVSPEKLAAGERFEVRSGEILPMDGVIIEGQAFIDESILSGEAKPIKKRPGDEVLSGSAVISGVLVLEKERSGRESFAGQVLRLVEQAITSRNRNEIIADSISRFFVPSVFFIALSTSLVLWFLGSPSPEVLLRGLTVLLIACPCSLGLAMPLAKVAVISVARKQGLLIREPDAIERLGKVDVAIFDKTGTLTEGAFTLQEIMPNDELEDQSETLARLAAVERCSAHVLGREVVRAAANRRLPELGADDCEVTDGLGVMGTVLGTAVYIGNREFMQQKTLQLSTELNARAEQKENQGMTAVFYGWSQRVKGLLLFGDTLKKSARQAVETLRSKGVAVWIVSGDSAKTTKTVAEEIGVDCCVGKAVPAEKTRLVERLQKEGHCVAMIGDGINDAPAIAQADVGIAIASSNDIVRQASDITLLASEPTALNTAFDLSLRASRVVAQNLFFAFAYNACAVPLAIAGLLNPPIAVCTMFLSSLTVTANALRLFKKREGALGQSPETKHLRAAPPARLRCPV